MVKIMTLKHDNSIFEFSEHAEQKDKDIIK